MRARRNDDAPEVVDAAEVDARLAEPALSARSRVRQVEPELPADDGEVGPKVARQVAVQAERRGLL